ncbi:HD domain-containing protein [Lactococcus kimchii]|uniref:HD domain-containing protein n=1 Tax=Lactococcus sp. S-13 TaxID=2507158 RepID=UPI001023EC0C|nr:HD domain-containing protein [Lactococcus sp. S-13]RZI49452.1 HD domain-containing protein [Lactococcus sp. S-13]
MINLEKIANFASDIHCQNNDGHGFDHIERVVALAEKILLTEPTANRELVLAACYLHDSYDEKLTTDVARRKSSVAQFLKEIQIQQDTCDEIFYIIDNMSYSSNLVEKKVLNLNGQIVQDADRLDALGAWGIVRTLEYGWSKNRVLYNPKIHPNSYASKADYHAQEKNTTINHFYEKLFLLKSLLNTAEAKRIGEHRDKIMHDFVKEIEREYKENYEN